MIDNTTLLIAIALSSGALSLTLLTSWLNSRQEAYLLSWATGVLLVMFALTAMGLRYLRYDLLMQVAPFTVLLIGLGIIYLGARQFRYGKTSIRPPAAVTIAAIVISIPPFLFGLSGLGTILVNVACAVLVAIAGYQYWACRDEFRVPLILNSILYWVVAAAFFACGAVLVADGNLVLDAPPDNWAEALNSIAAIVGITGVGAISLMLNHYRAARTHRRDALTDSLTGLLNRRALFDRFSAGAIPAGTGVLMFDIDHFKRINDAEGHAAGDAVLQHFADILRNNVREVDTVARIGGEEFCAVLNSTAVEQVQAIAERIRAEFEAVPAQLGDQTIAATVSIGIAIGTGGEDFPSALNHADAALYKAKGSGRNQVTTANLRLIA